MLPENRASSPYPDGNRLDGKRKREEETMDRREANP